MKLKINIDLKNEEKMNKKEFGKIKLKQQKNYMNMIYHIHLEYVQIKI